VELVGKQEQEKEDDLILLLRSYLIWQEHYAALPRNHRHCGRRAITELWWRDSADKRKVRSRPSIILEALGTVVVFL